MLSMLFIVLGAVGSLASVIALFKFETASKIRLLHAIYLVLFACMGALAAWQEFELSAIESVGRQAAQLADDREMKYTAAGFVQASLTFLEVHQKMFPDTYARAKQICHTMPDSDPDAITEELKCAGGVNSASFELEGILRSVATMQKKD